MNDLQRECAPITTAAWRVIDEEARRTLKLLLAARKIVDFKGPLGWEASAIGLGRVSFLAASPEGSVRAALRLVQALVELRVPFELSREELRTIDRGAIDTDLQPVKDAARAIALAEDRAVFHGYAAAHIAGMCEAARGEALTIPDDYEQYPRVVAAALGKLRSAGVDGPYALALGPRCYTGLTQTATKSGYPVIQHVQRLIDGPLIWTPGLQGAVAISMRGGDFELVIGRDLSVGYETHTDQTVTLYLEESFTFRVVTPEAAVPLLYAAAASRKG